MPSLLVVDDEPNVLYSLETGFRSDRLRVLGALTAREGIDLVAAERPDAVLLDVRLPDMSGLDAFERMREIDPRLPVIIMTAFDATETAIEAMKRGAFEYLLKPVDFHELEEVVTRAIDQNRLARVPAVFEEAPAGGSAVDPIVGRSAAMREVYKAIGRLAAQDVNVLVLGESGTGKELVARALYQHSRRAGKPFLAINCAAIPENLLESELFGHERGAFTGADRRRIGKFEQADGGTLFLDEIGDMAAATQAKVLRLLQEQRFERVGGDQTVQTDVRVIAATNQDLEGLVAAGRFRQDLFYRLNGFIIRLPPLRERAGDVPLLAEHFVRHYGREFDRQVRTVAPEAMRLLEAYAWQGNVRELQSTLKYAVIHATGETLLPEFLPDSVRGVPAPPDPAGISLDASSSALAALVTALLRAGETDIYRKASLAADRIILEVVLQHTHGHLAQASELLGISRTTLRGKLRALGMAVEKQLLNPADPRG